jgi:hypothetical protein
LHKDGHQAGESDDPQKSVLELSTGLQVRPPVTRVHVADTDKNRGPDKSPPLPPKASLVVGHFDGTVHSLQRHVAEIGGHDSIWSYILLAARCLRLRVQSSPDEELMAGLVVRDPTPLAEVCRID